MGADDTALAEASTLTAGLLSGVAAAATGALGSTAGFNGGGVIAEELGKAAVAETSGVGGFAGAETAGAIAAGAATGDEGVGGAKLAGELMPSV